MGSRQGVLKVAAGRIGIPVDVYLARINAGEKWCTACKEWHLRSSFQTDRSRGDGLKASCRASARGKPRFPRDPLKERARSRVACAARYGQIPRANDLPCTDCGHIWKEGERRHEYDHYLGYAPEHNLDIEAVCTLCHADRSKQHV